MALVGVDKLAKIMKLTPRRVQQLVEEGMPKSGRGKYDPEKCLQWYVEYLKSPSAADSGGDGYKKALTEKMYWQAQRAKLEYERLAGTLLNADEAVQGWARVVKGCRDRLLYFPKKVSPHLVGRTVAEIYVLLEEEIRQALEELARGADVAAKK